MVAFVMGGRGLWGGWQIVIQALRELRSERDVPIVGGRDSDSDI